MNNWWLPYIIFYSFCAPLILWMHNNILFNCIIPNETMPHLVTILYSPFTFSRLCQQKAQLNNTPGPISTKLTTYLVNVSLKIKMLISEMCEYFLLKKCEKLLQCKSFSYFSIINISVFDYIAVKHLTSWPPNKLVKRMMLWTTGPCLLETASKQARHKYKQHSAINNCEMKREHFSFLSLFFFFFFVVLY